MTVCVKKPVQGGTIKAIASKSEAHRLLICAALADSETSITCPQRSEDIDATARSLQSMGASLRYEGDSFLVTPIPQSPFPAPQSPNPIDCGESGSTLRFLLPVCGALGLSVSFNMKGRLGERPISALRDTMASHGCTLETSPEPLAVVRLVEGTLSGGSSLTCEGKLTHGKYTLPGNVSSQFVSGLLFALPLLRGESIIRVTNDLESRPYIDMTLDTLRLFGITIAEEEAQVFRIPGGQTMRSPGKAGASGDWSNAAFWLSAGAIGKSAVTCTGLDQGSRQGDRAIVELLERFGAVVTRKHDAVTVSPGALLGTEIDAGNTPDLVPVLAAVASVAEGKTVIRNAARLRIKESDRLHTVALTLSALGADIREIEDGLVINGKKTLTGGEIQSHGDHRIAMTAAILSAACTAPVIIRDAGAVRKSYPAFFEDFISLGGVCEYLR
ncbi:MAG: 3-phosphoshikimate 1-carboxyvinyltransferase [Treponema sp.]|nr:3-phosphoshikimate 1-carboxyvinyltransferase [Treponema sp.]